MRQVPFGASGQTVSELCLGTMTWGNQTPAADAHRQMDMALSAGVDIVDTAEMYPVNPVKAETVGGSEAILGDWNAANLARRGDFLLATKISGENGSFVRPGELITGKTLRSALEGSLKRLKTDYVDLYQLHWPNRGSFQFRKNWTYDPGGQDKAETLAHIEDVLAEAAKLVAEGKMRFFGLSNESTWGTAQWLRVSEARKLPRVQTVQNEYSLLCRMYDTDMAELSVNEAVTLLAFSPLAAGLLTGKYQDGAEPDGSRLAVARATGQTPDLGGRLSDRVRPAVAAYLDIAARHGLDPVHMALAWQQTRPFAVSTIFGATTSAQLEHLLPAAGMTLPQEVLDEIAAAHKAHPMPY
ncbi:MAG: aldo/keto reductase [Rhodobacteraceae bacterium CG17_big_fil_post_rev_8_21_14_2_50_65_11]|nr:MAG: aldo/keto reductase [Rhodobacteraceae bacterium CG17_big_fil_post_rev_8_21_14_2_50_65_11]